MFFVHVRGQNLVNDAMKYPERVHVYDRTPEASIIYQIIFANLAGDTFDERGLRLYLDALKEVKKTIHFKFCALVMLCKRGQEKLCVEVMKRRNNNIDILTEKYVTVQNRVFAIYAQVMGYPTFEVDYTKDLTEQQAEITNALESLIDYHEKCNVYYI